MAHSLTQFANYFVHQRESEKERKKEK